MFLSELSLRHLRLKQCAHRSLSSMTTYYVANMYPVDIDSNEPSLDWYVLGRETPFDFNHVRKKLSSQKSIDLVLFA